LYDDVPEFIPGDTIVDGEVEEPTVDGAQPAWLIGTVERTGQRGYIPLDSVEVKAD
jgi:hypothetical protein